MRPPTPSMRLPALLPVFLTLSLSGTAMVVAPLGPGGGAEAHQAGDLRLEVGAGRILPPSGTSATSADYLTGSLQVDRWWSDSDGVFAMLGGGLDAEGDGGDWVSASAGFVVRPLGGPTGPSLALEAAGYAFSVGGPYAYRAWTVEATPVAALPLGRFTLGLRGEAGIGRSTAEFRIGDRSRIVETDLESWGGGPEAHVAIAGTLLTFDAAWIRSHDRTFRRIGSRIAGGDRVRWQGRIDRWNAPRNAVTSGEVSVSLSLGSAGDWIAGARGGRSQPDPLTLTRPGNHGGITLARSLVTFGEDESSSVVEVVSSDGEAATVRISIRAEEATRVELLADFTDWVAVPMNRDGREWTLETEVAAGVYHFGFLLDGDWFVPGNAPGLTSDDWGRLNATLVVQ